MSQPEEFSLESVRQLMLAHGGRVTNHSLVKSYRQWLTDPQLKDQARAQFKVSIILGAVSSPAVLFLRRAKLGTGIGTYINKPYICRTLCP
jgi:hypothetical protein